ncbi:MAG: hypothetical protein P4L90_12285 [Rhodopila sp.]|nr:hypothetical protein [Rhodopila sp.]
MTLQTAWPWLTFAGLGLFHGLNPAMGWLFAVALGLHRHSRRAVLLALPPMAAGHALSIWLVAASVMAVGAVVNAPAIHLAAGSILMVWAGYHWLYGHRHRVRVGMTAGIGGLAVWSFLMATAHGAGLMLVPALVPLCASLPTVGRASLLVSLAAVAVHTLTMLVATGLIAVVVYEWLGLAFLRRSWINFDLLWTGALVATGLVLIITA